MMSQLYNVYESQLQLTFLKKIGTGWKDLPVTEACSPIVRSVYIFIVLSATASVCEAVVGNKVGGKQ